MLITRQPSPVRGLRSSSVRRSRSAERRSQSPDARDGLAPSASSDGALRVVHTPRYFGLKISEARQPVALKQALPAMPGANARADVYISEVREIPGTYLAMFGDREGMNITLLRASTFVEGKKLQSDAQLMAGNGLRSIGGHDLMGADLLRFWHAYAPRRTTRGPRDVFRCEDDFWEQWLLPKLAENPALILISGASLGTPGELRAVLSHELMHAQLFKSPVYEQTVRTFWDSKVSVTSRDAVRYVLGANGHYDPNDDFQMANEFQAYILQRDARHGNYAQLAPIVGRYRKPLLKALAQAGEDVIRLDVGPSAPHSFGDRLRRVWYPLGDVLARLGLL